VTVKISNDPVADYNGTYNASGTSTRCGLADYGFPHRVNAFAVMFPDEPTTMAVTSVNFDADTLKSGSTTTSFYLSVGIRVGPHGRPTSHSTTSLEPPPAAEQRTAPTP
jgi:hypothetical protein